jgi:hypothetical protein
MCHYVTLIAATDDRAALRAVMDRHGRAAEPIDNPSVRKVLLPGERQYLTTRGHCDCGTVLAPRHLESREDFEDRLAREASKLARKGWSEAKIARATEDRRKAAARPDGGGCDSLELWVSVILDLTRELRLSRVGLFVRSYSGLIASETFTATRREAPPSLPLAEALASMEHDEVTIFRGNG